MQRALHISITSSYLALRTPSRLSGTAPPQRAKSRRRNMLLFTVEQAIWGMSLLNRYSPSHFSQVNRAVNGVYYVASQSSEVSPWYILNGKTQRLDRRFS